MIFKNVKYLKINLKNFKPTDKLNHRKKQITSVLLYIFPATYVQINTSINRRS